MRNRILDSSSRSALNVPEDPDQTYCSKAEKSRNETKKPSDRDTVIGAYSDEELSSRFSVMSMKSKVKQNSVRSSRIADTIAGAFSDLSDQEDTTNATRRSKRISSRRQVESLADTVMKPSSSEGSGESDEEVPERIQKSLKQINLAKRSVPDTVIGGLSDTFDEMSLSKASPDILEDHAVTEESVASEYDDEVISILDSSEEEFNDEPPLKTATSFINCSTAESSKKTSSNSDTTLNKFFNNPPSIDTPERVVTHSQIRRQQETPKSRSSKSPDRFKKQDKSNEDSLTIDEIVIPETDGSMEASEASIAHETSAAPQSSEVVPSQKTPTVKTFSTKQSIESRNGTPTVVNVSAKININLKISMQQDSDTSSSTVSETTSSSCTSMSSSSSSSEDSQPAPPPTSTSKRKENLKTSTPQNKPGTSTKAKAQISSLREAENPPSPPACATPTIVEPSMIDEVLQQELDQLYGDEWKTPENAQNLHTQKTGCS